MAQREHRSNDSHFSKWSESNSNSSLDEVARLSEVRAHAVDEAGVRIARQLNGPLTALLLYVGEIKHHSHQLAQGGVDRAYLEKVVENALQQTERVCAMIKQIADPHAGSAEACGAGWEKRIGKAAVRNPAVLLAAGAGQKPLTRREREVLNLISEGCSNKQGALQMQISPRTFESHRAEAMRKLGARNTADLVRTALLHPGAF
jgi:DNA-binding NarL/FixJ family response regulator